MAVSVFGLSFEEWYQSGYWNEKYIPYTLFDGDKAIANASVNIMDFVVDGKIERFIQIGTVMADEKYRKKGLSRYLMGVILNEWRNKCFCIYLFANHTAVDYYPKLGFERRYEYQFFKKAPPGSGELQCTKLEMIEQKHRNFLYAYAKHSRVLNEFAMRENADLVMFYCIAFMKDNVYFVESLDTVVVAKFEGGCC